jgi:hypothetical protein
MPDPIANTETVPNVTEQTAAPAGGLPAVESVPVKFTAARSGQLGGISSSSGVSLDPQSTQGILANMQKMIAEKENPWNKFQSALDDMVARTQLHPAEAIRQRQEANQQDMSDVYNMRQQMAQLQAAQKMGELRSRGLSQLTAGAGATGAGTGGGLSGGIDPLILQRVDQLNSMGQYDAADKIYNAAIIDVNKLNRGAVLNKDTYAPGIPKRLPGGGIGYESVYDRLQSKISRGENLEPEEKAALKSYVMGTSPDEVTKAIYGQESSSGKAKTDVPNAKGVVGPMQIKDTTFKQYQDKGIIPKEYDINNPEHNKIAGELIIKDMYGRHAGDIEKIAAEYYGGAGAINKDGSINLDHRPDPKLFPNAPNVGEYIQQVKGRMSTNQQPQGRLVASTGPLTAEELNAPSIQKAGQEEFAKSTAKEYAGIATGIEKSGQTAGERLNRHDQSLKLLDDPEVSQMVGYLKNSTTGSALLRQMSDGIKVGNYTVGANKLGENLALSGASQTAINKFNQLDRNFAQNALEYAKEYLKGEGAVSDNERVLVERAVGSINDPATVLKTVAATMKERAQFDAVASDLYGRYKDTKGEYASFDKFLRSADYKQALSQHNAKLATILNVDKSELARNPGFKAPPTAPSGEYKGVPWKVIKQ